MIKYLGNWCGIPTYRFSSGQEFQITKFFNGVLEISVSNSDIEIMSKSINEIFCGGYFHGVNRVIFYIDGVKLSVDENNVRPENVKALWYEQIISRVFEKEEQVISSENNSLKKARSESIKKQGKIKKKNQHEKMHFRNKISEDEWKKLSKNYYLSKIIIYAEELAKEMQIVAREKRCSVKEISKGVISKMKKETQITNFENKIAMQLLATKWKYGGIEFYNQVRSDNV